MAHPDTIIVGAGIGGLTTALALQDAGQDVLVLEASDRPGGRVARVSYKGDSADAGAQGIHSNYDNMLRLIDRFGMTGDLMTGGGKVRYIGADGRARLSGSNLDMMRIMGVRGSADLAYFYTRYFRLAEKFDLFEIDREIPAYDDISASDAFAWASRKFIDYILRPMTCVMANSSPDHVNLYYIVNGLKQKMTTSVFTLRHGNVSLLERMAAQVPVRYDSRVSHVLSTGGVADGVELDDGTAIKAKHVVLACTAGGSGAMLPDDFADIRPFLNSFPHTPLPLVFFFMDRPIQMDSFAALGHPFREAAFNLAVNHSMKTPHLVPSGKTILSAWPAFPHSAELIGQSDDTVIAQALKDMALFHPGMAGMIEHVEVVRHPWGVARYGPGTHRRVLRFKQAAEKLRGLSFAGTDFDSIHMEAGVRSGMRAAQRALRLN